MAVKKRFFKFMRESRVHYSYVYNKPGEVNLLPDKFKPGRGFYFTTENHIHKFKGDRPILAEIELPQNPLLKCVRDKNSWRSNMIIIAAEYDVRTELGRRFYNSINAEFRIKELQTEEEMLLAMACQKNDYDLFEYVVEKNNIDLFRHMAIVLRTNNIQMILKMIKRGVCTQKVFYYALRQGCDLYTIRAILNYNKFCIGYADKGRALYSAIYYNMPKLIPDLCASGLTISTDQWDIRNILEIITPEIRGFLDRHYKANNREEIMKILN